MLTDFQLTQTTYFEWFQLIHAISHSWKLAVLNDKGDLKNIKNMKMFKPPFNQE